MDRIRNSFFSSPKESNSLSSPEILAGIVRRVKSGKALSESEQSLQNFLLAIENEDLKTISDFIKSGIINYEYKDKNGNNLLQIALMKYKLPPTELLVHSGGIDFGNWNKWRENSLHWICLYKLEPIIQYITSYYDSFGINNNHQLFNQSSFSGIHILHCAVRSGSEYILDKLINDYFHHFIDEYQSKDGYTIIMQSIYEDKPDITQKLLKFTKNINIKDKNYGRTALHFAAYRGDCLITKLLLDVGSNINEMDRFGRTPLHYSILSGDYYTVKQLIFHENESILNYNQYASSSPPSTAVSSINLYILDHHSRSPLHYAAFYGRTRLMQVLIDSNFSVNQKDLFLNTPLHYACYSGNLSSVELLIENNSTMYIKNNHQLTPLHISIIYNHEEIFTYLFKLIDHQKYGEIEKETVEINTNHTYNLFNKSDLSDKLTEKPILQSNQISNSGNTILHTAVLLNKLNLIKFILKNNKLSKLIINKKNKQGDTALHIACLYNFNKIIRLICKYKYTHVNIKNKFGYTPLHISVINQNLSTIKFLLKFIPSNPTINTSSQSLPSLPSTTIPVLHASSLSSSLSSSQNDALSSKGRELFINLVDNHGRSPLHYSNSLDISTLLITYSASIYLFDRFNKLPIHYAIDYYNLPLVNYLLPLYTSFPSIPSSSPPLSSSTPPSSFDASLPPSALSASTSAFCCSPSSKDPSSTSNTADCCLSINYPNYNLIHLAVLLNDYHQLQEFIHQYLHLTGNPSSPVSPSNSDAASRDYMFEFKMNLLNINSVNKKGRTPLMIACRYAHSHIVELLLSVDGISVNHTDQFGWSALHYAVSNQHISIIKQLVTHKHCDLLISDRHGRIPFHFSLHNHQSIRLLLYDESSAPVPSPNTSSPSSSSPTQLSPPSSQPNSASTTPTSTPVIKRSRHSGNSNTSSWVTSNTCSASAVNTQHSELRTSGNKSTTKLSSSNPNTVIQDAVGKQPAPVASASPQSSTNSLRKSNPANLMTIIGSRNQNTRGVDAPRPVNHNKHVKTLSANEIEVIRRKQLLCKDEEGYLPIHWMCARSFSIENVEYLLKYYKPHETITEDGNTLLHIVCRTGNKPLLIHLLNKYFTEENVRDPSTSGHNPLQVNQILNMENKEGNTPLLLLIKNNYIELIKILLNKTGVKVNYNQINIVSPLHLATRIGNRDIIEVIIDHRGDIAKVDKDGNTPLHIALMNKNIKAAKLLLKNGAPVDIPSDTHKTPLHYIATISNYTKLLQLLLPSPFNLTKDNKGKTAIHYAAKAGNLYGLTMFIQYQQNENKINIDDIDNKGRTALHYGCKYGKLEVVGYLLCIGGDYNRQTLDNLDTPLHFAAKYPRIYYYLLSRGADENMVNKNRVSAKQIFQGKDRGLHRVTFIRKNYSIAPPTSPIPPSTTTSSTSPSSTSFTLAQIQPASGALKRSISICLKSNINPSLSSDLDDEEGGGGLSTSPSPSTRYLSKTSQLNRLLKEQAKQEVDQSPKSGITAAGSACSPSSPGSTSWVKVKIDKSATNEGTKLSIGQAQQQQQQQNEQQKESNQSNTLSSSPQQTGTGMGSVGQAPGHQSINQKEGNLISTNMGQSSGNLSNTIASAGTGSSSGIISGKYRASNKINPRKASMGIENQAAEGKKGGVGGGKLHKFIIKGNLEGVYKQINKKGVDINIKDQQGNTGLLLAIKYNQVQLVSELLTLKADPNQRDQQGNTALSIAIEESMKEIISLLLMNGADTNQLVHNKSYLSTAVCKGDSKLMNQLINYGSYIDVVQTLSGKTALHLASQFGYYAAIKLLLYHGATIDRLSANLLSPLHLAVKVGKYNCIELLLNEKADVNKIGYNGRNALHFASTHHNSNSVDIIKLLIHSSVNLNHLDDNKRSALHIACRNTSLDTIYCLLEHLSSDIVNLPDNSGYTSFHYACTSSLESCKLLLTTHKAFPSLFLITNDHKNIIHLITENNQDKILDFIIYYFSILPMDVYKSSTVALLPPLSSPLPPASPSRHSGSLDLSRDIKNSLSGIELLRDRLINEKNGEGLTALHIAITNKNVSIIAKLIELSANVHIQDDKGNTPMYYAINSANPDIISLLLHKRHPSLSAPQPIPSSLANYSPLPIHHRPRQSSSLVANPLHMKDFLPSPSRSLTIDANNRSILSSSPDLLHSKLVKLYKEDENSIFYLSAIGNMNEIKYLLYSDPFLLFTVHPISLKTPLHFIIEFSHVQLVELFFQFILSGFFITNNQFLFDRLHKQDVDVNVQRNHNLFHFPGGIMAEKYYLENRNIIEHRYYLPAPSSKHGDRKNPLFIELDDLFNKNASHIHEFGIYQLLHLLHKQDSLGKTILHYIRDFHIANYIFNIPLHYNILHFPLFFHFYSSNGPVQSESKPLLTIDEIADHKGRIPIHKISAILDSTIFKLFISPPFLLDPGVNTVPPPTTPRSIFSFTTSDDIDCISHGEIITNSPSSPPQAPPTVQPATPTEEKENKEKERPNERGNRNKYNISMERVDSVGNTIHLFESHVAKLNANNKPLSIPTSKSKIQPQSTTHSPASHCMEVQNAEWTMDMLRLMKETRNIYNKITEKEGEGRGEQQRRKEITSKLNRRNKKGRTVTHYAAGNGAEDTIAIIVGEYRSYLDDLSVTDCLGLNGLHYSIKHNHMNTSRLLLQANININENSNALKQTPLFFAIKNRNLNLIKMILDYSANHYDSDSLHKPSRININEKDKKGNTALHHSCYLYDKNIIQILLNEKNINLTSLNHKKLIPLEIIIQQKNYNKITNKSYEIIYLFYQYGLGMDYIGRNKWSLLQQSIIYGCENSCKILLQLNANVNHLNSKGENTALLAAKFNRFALLKLLKQFSANFHQLNYKNQNCLHKAAKNKNVEMVRWLLETFRELEVQKDLRNFFPFHYACFFHAFPLDDAGKGRKQVAMASSPLDSANPIECFDILIQSFISNCPSYSQFLDDFHFNFIHFSSLIQSKKSMIEFIHRGFTMNQVGGSDLQLNSMFLYLIAFRFQSCVSSDSLFFFKNLIIQCDPDLHALSKNNDTILHFAAACLSSGFLEYLMECQGDLIDFIDKPNDFGCTPFHFAVLSQSIECCKYLMDRYHVDIHSLDNYGNNSLIKALSTSNSSLIQLLIENNASLFHVNNRKQSILHFAAYFGNIDVCNLIISSPTFKTVDLLDGFSSTPLIWSIYSSNIQLVSCFIDHKANPNHKDDLGLSPLLLSVLRNQFEIVNYLIHHTNCIVDEYTNYKQFKGMNIVHISTYLKHSECLNVLLKSKHIQLYSSITADKKDTILHIAVRNNDVDTVKLIQSLSSNFNNIDLSLIQNIDGKTPITLAEELNLPHLFPEHFTSYCLTLEL